MLFEQEFSRNDRLSSQLKKIISVIIQNKLKDKNIGFTTVTNLNLTPDLKLAYVYISVYGKEYEKKNTVEALNKAKGYIKHEINKNIRLKFIPELKFFLDHTFEYKDKMNRILEQEKHKKQEKSNLGLQLNEKDIFKLKQINSKITESENILLTCHQRPDGDAIGSILCIYNYISQLDKKAEIVVDGPCPHLLEWLPDTGLVRDDKLFLQKNKFDLVICLDSNFSERNGYVYDYTSDYITDDNLIIIDHHKGSANNTDLKIVKTAASSTAELIYNFFEINNIELNNKTALYLYVGIQTDTYMLSQDNTSSSVLKIASELITYPSINPYYITSKLFENKSLKRTKLMGHMINNIKIIPEIKLGYSFVKLEDFEKTDTTIEDTESFINVIRSINNIKIAMFIKELKDNTIKVNFRTKGDIDIIPVVEHFNGGGHKKAAGFELEGNIKDNLDKIIKYLKEYFN